MGKIDAKKQNMIIKKNSSMAIVFKGAEYFLSFFTAPVLLSMLGEDKYGVYTSALSVVSWIYFFDFGIGSGLRNKVSQCIVKEKYDEAHKSINVAYIIVSIVSIIAFALILLLSFFVDFNTAMNAKLNNEDLNGIIIVAVFFACLNFVMALGINVLLSLQRTALVSGLGVLSKCLIVLSLLLFRFFGLRQMLYVVIIEGCAQLVKNIVAFICIYKSDRRLSPDFKNVDFKYAKGIMGFGLQIFIMQISALILSSTDNIVIMKCFGSADVTPYSMCHKYFSIIEAFFIAATGPLWTTYTNAYTLNDAKFIKATLRTTLKFYGVFFIGIVLSCFFFKPFMRIYLGQELHYTNGLIGLVALYYVILILSHVFSAFVHGISKVKLTTIACLVSAIMNIPISIFLGVNMQFGLKGIILGSIICLLINTIAYVYTTVYEIRKMEKETV